ncbi:hypothetical protein HNV12_03040 [Methanococcoides sp. SA1]|nr:hypothetical protein [Methanococcoides sp. SA1]
MEELEKIKKAFILDKNAELDNLMGSLKRVLKYMSVDSSGYVIFKNPKINFMTTKKKILAISIARFLANKLQEQAGDDQTISPNIDRHQVSKILKIKETVASARLKDLKDERSILADKGKNGEFHVAPYSVEPFLDELDRNFDTH